jgi:acyl-CoA reductase-like NAD-dependent aldehyde dehydrogenase
VRCPRAERYSLFWGAFINNGQTCAALKRLYVHDALQLQCGTAWINKHSPVQPNAPFGGVKSSGFGVEFGEEGLAENTDIQVIWS